MTAYKRTATRSLTPIAEVYEKAISAETLTQARRESPYLHVLHLPDDRRRRDAETGEVIGHGETYELAVRDPLILTKHGGGCHPTSPIRELIGPFTLERVLDRVSSRAENGYLPIYEEVYTLRPAHWLDAASWVSCPSCTSRSGAIALITDLDADGVTFACRECDARIGESEQQRMFNDWLHCPSCNSGDINVECSAPLGSVWWSCDDCLYDTHPAPVDLEYGDAREEIPQPTSSANGWRG
jgi:predicted RNA-binding Zn-ribbon protein involved in translation (DUF1610 family)